MTPKPRCPLPCTEKGVYVSYAPRCANLCFGGPQRTRLFMCGSTAIYSLYVNTQGVPYV